MHFALTQTSAPAAEPLSTAEAKAHLRVDISTEDALIDALVGAARLWVEAFTRRALVTQSWALRLDWLPPCIFVPKPPLQSVTSIQYVDSDGAPQTLDPSLYQVDAASEPGRIVPAYGQTWPATRAQPGAVTVTYVAGYGAAAAVPVDYKRQMLLLVGHLYRNRESVVVGTNAMPMPQSIEFALWHHRAMTF